MYKILCGVTLLLLLCGTVGALEISDNQDDVEHYIKDPFSQEYVSDKPNLDVTHVYYSADAEVVTLQLTVKGEIQEDASITYYTEYECSDALYQFTYSNGNLNSQASEMVNGEKNLIGQSIGHTIDPVNTITVTYNVIGVGGEDGDLYGYAGKDFPLGDEYWIDNTEEIDDGPVDGNGGNGDGGNDGNNGSSEPSTPGFELFTLIAAIGTAIFLLKKGRHP
jgi:hypothetical protein